MASEKPNIFQYNNYREYLQAALTYLKRHDPTFSQRAFAAKAGFKAHSFCAYLIRGKRNLSDDSAGNLCAALGLDPRETKFFKSLVEYTQAGSTDQRDRLFHELNQIRGNTKFYKLRKNQYTYLDKWYYPVLREVVSMNTWGGDYAVLGRMLDPPINEAKARKAVHTLESQGLIRKDKSGKWVQTDTTIRAEDIPQHLVKKARNTYIRMALDASENLGPQSRNISCATVALSAGNYRKVSQMLDTVHAEIVRLAAEDKSADRVFQLNLQLFPLSRRNPDSPTRGVRGNE
jgi:uncharacterized protein (TIGR02147 family)